MIHDESDVIMKLYAVHRNMNKRMRDLINRANTQRIVGKECVLQYPLTKELRQVCADLSEVNPLLLDMKTVFEAKGNDGVIGVREEEFLETFGPVFLPGGKGPELAQWFTSIDYDANGLVGWDEFCSFLMSSRHIPQLTNEQEFSISPCYYETDGHRDVITHLIHNPDNDVYYSAGVDGTVRMWSPSCTAQPSRVIHHIPHNALLSDMRWIESMNRLLILQSDRTVFVYDCGVLGRSRRNATLKIFKGVDNFTRDFTKQKPMAYRLVEKSVESKSEHGFGPDMVASLKGEKRKKKRKTLHQSEKTEESNTADKEVVGSEAIPLYDLTGTTMAIDYATWSSAYLLGTEGGYVNYYSARRLDSGDEEYTHKPINRWRPHTGWVTKVQAVASLDGYISSSTDETIQIMNIEKSQTYSRMRDDSSVKSIHGLARRENKGVFGFDYSPELNLLVSWGENRKFIIWNPLTATCLFHRMEHTHPLTQVMFKPNHQLISVSVDKTIKIWDTRTFKCMQTLVDKQTRLNENHFRCLTWDDTRKTIVTGDAAPVLFRTRVIQERLEAGISIQKQVTGHVRPVNIILHNERFGHIVTIDRDYILTWDLTLGKQVGSWCPEMISAGHHRLTAASLSGNKRRLVVCVDDGHLYIMNYIRKITLKTLATKCREEMSLCMSVTTNQGMVHAEHYIIAAGAANKILVFSDDQKFHADTEMDEPLHTMPLGKTGFVSGMKFMEPARLMVSTNKGFIVLYNLNNMSLVAICNNVAGYSLHEGTANMRRAITAATGASVVSSQQTTKLAQTVNKNRNVVGASTFTAFQSLTQKHVTNLIESFVLLNPTTVVTLHGSGGITLWRIAKDTLQSSAVVCIPGSHGPGEAARAFELCPYSNRLLVGDDEGYVSGFNFQEYLSRAAREEASLRTKPPGRADEESVTNEKIKKKRGKNTEAPRDHAIRLVMSFKAHQSSVNSITTLKCQSEKPCIISGGSDCVVKVWDSEGHHLSTFGNRGGWTHVFLHGHEAAGEEEIQDLEPDTTGSIATHYFRVLHPSNVNAPATLLGDVIANNTHNARPSEIQIKEDTPRDKEPEPINLPLIGDSRAEADSSRWNVRRMVEFSIKRTRDPSLKRHLELQKMEPIGGFNGFAGTINLAIDKVKDRQKYKNPTSSQYSALDLFKPDLAAPGKRNGDHMAPVPDATSIWLDTKTRFNVRSMGTTEVCRASGCDHPLVK